MAKRKKKVYPKIGRKVVRSEFEFQVFKALQAILPKGATIEYESEKLPYVIEAEYLPDFVVTLKDGRKIYLEAKGNGRSFDGNVRKKMIAVKNQHKDIDLRLIFYSNGKVGQVRKDGSCYRQGDWAAKEGFPFVIREIPKGWLE
jgi:hypothetical protein